MKPMLKNAYESEMVAAKQSFTDQKYEECFYHLERAHILGQRYYIPHVISHWWMLKVGWNRSDRKETFGQIIRLIASFASLFGWVPVGNTGGTNISALSPLPIPDDLKPYLKAEKMPSLLLAITKLLLVAAAIALLIRVY